MTTGEGGMLTTDDAAVADRVRHLSLHGMSRDAWKRYSGAGSWYYEVEAPGFKCNMTDIQAALGIHQLRKLDGKQSVLLEPDRIPEPWRARYQHAVLAAFKKKPG